MNERDYYCRNCREWFDRPAPKVYCPNCDDDDEPPDPDLPLIGRCSTCGYAGEMDFICPKCEIAGCEGGLLNLGAVIRAEVARRTSLDGVNASR